MKPIKFVERPVAPKPRKTLREKINEVRTRLKLM